MTKASRNISPASSWVTPRHRLAAILHRTLPWNHALPGPSAADSVPPKSFAELLNGPWLPLPDLFAMRSGPSGYPPMFYAQSWIVMHYLLNQNKLSEAGTYFGLVQIRKVPVEQAIQQAFGMSAAQLEQAVKDYFHAFASAPQAQPNTQGGRQRPRSAGEPVSRSPGPARCRSQCGGRSQGPGAIAGRGNGGAPARTSRSGRERPPDHHRRPQGGQRDRAPRPGLGPHGERRIR